MPDNRDEIVRLAEKMAKMIVGDISSPGNPNPVQRLALQLVALISPPEPEKPKRHPVINAEPKVAWALRDHAQVWASNGAFSVYGPICSTEAAAVECWNAMIARIAGADDETVRLMKDIQSALPLRSDSLHSRIDRWLAERTGGSDGR